MSQCTHVKADGQRCKTGALKNEEFCLFHSKSDQVKEIRKRAARLPDKVIGRKELLRALSNDFKALAGKKDAGSQIQRTKLAALIIQLKGEMDDLSKIRRVAKEKGLLI
jgi:hypothetical protein